MKRLSVFFFAGLFVIGSFAVAQAADGVYMSVKAGLANLTDSDLTALGETAELSYDNGYGVSAAVGGVISSFRVEGELAFRTNDMDEWTDSVGTDSAKGDVEAWSVMANGYFDFIIQGSPITPYVGLGAGMVKVDVTDDEDSWSDDDTVVGYQIMAGVAYAFNDQFSLELEYRYLGTQDPEFEIETVKIESEYSSHNVNLGARITF